jgi:hypothetical protein
MKIVVKSVRSLDDNSFEVELTMDGRLCHGKVTREPAGSIYLWHPDPNLSRIWSNAGFLSRHMMKIVNDFSKGQLVQFPIDLGEF